MQKDYCDYITTKEPQVKIGKFQFGDDEPFPVIIVYGIACYDHFASCNMYRKMFKLCQTLAKNNLCGFVNIIMRTDEGDIILEIDKDTYDHDELIRGDIEKIFCKYFGSSYYRQVEAENKNYPSQIVE